MYIPPAYDASDLATQHALMREWSFAVLFSQQDGLPVATHLPVLLEEGGSHGLGRLRMHMARNNPQWRHFESGGRALVVFPGPHAYVSVNWYEGQQTFPTWNYGAVHAAGPVTLVHDPEWLRRLLEDTIATYDGPLGGSWRMEDVDPAKTERLLGLIVGLTIEIETLEGKLKFNQDKPQEDRRNVTRHLLACPESAAAGRFMARMLPEHEETGR